jgi:hypothetical protein
MEFLLCATEKAAQDTKNLLKIQVFSCWEDHLFGDWMFPSTTHYSRNKKQNG